MFIHFGQELDCDYAGLITKQMYEIKHTLPRLTDYSSCNWC